MLTLKQKKAIIEENAELKTKIGKLKRKLVMENDEKFDIRDFKNYLKFNKNIDAGITGYNQITINMTDGKTLICDIENEKIIITIYDIFGNLEEFVFEYPKNGDIYYHIMLFIIKSYNKTINKKFLGRI